MEVYLHESAGSCASVTPLHRRWRRRLQLPRSVLPHLPPDGRLSSATAPFCFHVINCGQFEHRGACASWVRGPRRLCPQYSGASYSPSPAYHGTSVEFCGPASVPTSGSRVEHRRSWASPMPIQLHARTLELTLDALARLFHETSIGSTLLHQPWCRRHHTSLARRRLMDAFILFNPGLGVNRWEAGWEATTALSAAHRPVLITGPSPADAARDEAFLGALTRERGILARDVDSQPRSWPLPQLHGQAPCKRQTITMAVKMT